MLTVLRSWLCRDILTEVARLSNQVDAAQQGLADCAAALDRHATDLSGLDERITHAVEQISVQHAEPARPKVRIARNFSEFRHAAEQPRREDS